MSKFDTVIRGAEVVTPDGVTRVDVGIAAGRIAALAPDLPGSSDVDLHARDALLVPGMIDAHVHFNEPGRGDWEGFATGSSAAAAGGVTTIFDMPLNSSPATLTPADYAAKQALAREKSVVNVRLWGGLTPDNLDQLEALHACGVVAFKAFMSASGIEEFRRADEATLRAGMKIIARLPGMRVAVHAEDEELTARLAAEARAAGRTDARAFVASRPIKAEERAIQQVLALAAETGCPLHIVHVSSAEGLGLISAAKARGLDVTAETCPHYLLLTSEAMESLGAVAKCAPPLRGISDQDRLWASLMRGEVDSIGSDHSPCPPAMKVAADFFSAWGGISGVQHALPLFYAAGLRHGMAFERIAHLLSAGPARVFGLGKTHGVIAPGAVADLCLLRRTPGVRVKAEDLRYRHRQSPYIGRDLPLSVERTWVQGRLVYAAAA